MLLYTSIVLADVTVRGIENLNRFMHFRVMLKPHKGLECGFVTNILDYSTSTYISFVYLYVGWMEIFCFHAKCLLRCIYATYVLCCVDFSDTGKDLSS